MVDAGWVTSVSGPPSDGGHAAPAAPPRRTRRPASRPPARSKATSVRRERHLPLGQVVLRVRRRAPGSAPRRHRGWPRAPRPGAGPSRLWRREPHRQRADAPQAVHGVERRGAARPAAPRSAQTASISSALAGDHAEGGVVVAGDALGGRVEHEVDAVVERLLHDRRGEGGVDHGDRALRWRRARRGRPASSRGLAGVSANTSMVLPGTHRRGERAGLGAVDERDVDAEARTGALQQQLGARVDLALGDDVVARRAEAEHHRGHRAHARRRRPAPPRRPRASATASSKPLHRRVAVAAVEAVGAGRRRPCRRASSTRRRDERGRGPQHGRQRVPLSSRPARDGRSSRGAAGRVVGGQHRSSCFSTSSRKSVERRRPPGRAR